MINYHVVFNIGTNSLIALRGNQDNRGMKTNLRNFRIVQSAPIAVDFYQMNSVDARILTQVGHVFSERNIVMY